jgi:hypothetical protein
MNNSTGATEEEEEEDMVAEEVAEGKRGEGKKPLHTHDTAEETEVREDFTPRSILAACRQFCRLLQEEGTTKRKNRKKESGI